MDPLIIAERIHRMLTNREHVGLSQGKSDLVEDLRNLADWLERDGFVPFVDPATGRAPK